MHESQDFHVRYLEYSRDISLHASGMGFGAIVRAAELSKSSHEIDGTEHAGWVDTVLALTAESDYYPAGVTIADQPEPMIQDLGGWLMHVVVYQSEDVVNATLAEQAALALFATDAKPRRQVIDLTVHERVESTVNDALYIPTENGGYDIVPNTTSTQEPGSL